MGNIAAPLMGDGSEKYQVLARVDQGAKVTAKKGNITRTFREKNGIAILRNLPDGVWEIEASVGTLKNKKEVEILGDNQRQIIWLHLNKVPDFEATGLIYKIVNDKDDELNEFAGTTGDWKIRFEQNFNGAYGTIKFKDLHGQKVDIFIVGGGGNGTFSYVGWGGCGGGGGYTATFKNITLEENVEYRIVVGGPCGRSSFSKDTGSPNYFANGGQSGYEKLGDGSHGGNGGCGGGGGHGRNNGNSPNGKSGNGGSDGGDGTKGADGYFYGKPEHQWFYVPSFAGKGQHSTTREFGEKNGTLYSSGGAGGSVYSGYEGTPGDGIRTFNSGAGGSGNTPNAARQYGMPGIVIIRNAR